MVELDIIGQRALSTRQTLHGTYGIVRMLIEEGIPGDFVECGVFAGSQAAAMVKAMLDAGDVLRKVHLFDSFQGIPAGGEHDTNWTHPAGTSACSRESVARHMQQWGVPPELLVWHAGWFQDTVPEANIQQIALLRLDGDLYESTIVCLGHLFPRVVPGGWIIADDYGLPGCRKAVDQFLGSEPIYFRK
jgi:O-methyltransferase